MRNTSLSLVFILESWGDGGTEKYVETLGRELVQRSDVKIHLILLAGEKEALPGFDWVASVHVLSSKGHKVRKQLKQSVEALNPDICHLHLYTSMLTACMALRGLKSVCMVTTFHSPVSVWNPLHKLKFFFSCKMVKAVIAGSEFTASELTRWRPDVSTCSPPIMVPDVPRSRPLNDTTFLICGCGRLAREKDWGTLFRALAIVKKNNPREILCEIVGEGSERAVLEAQIAELGLGRSVILRGRLPHDEAMQRVANADLFVLPSRFEGFGMAAVEAMALGVSTITSAFPAAQEFIKENETGYRFLIADAGALAEKILWHIENREASRIMGATGKGFVRSRYAPSVIAGKHEDIYSKVIARR